MAADSGACRPSSWEPPEADLDESVEKLRAGALRMIVRGRQNPADYGPINIWPHTVLALLGAIEKAVEMLDHYTVSPEDAEAMRRAIWNEADRG